MKVRISILLAGLTAACGNSSSDASGDDAGTPFGPAGDAGVVQAPAPSGGPAPASDAGSKLPIGTPITAPPSTWTWVDFPDAVCDDGTPTGIGIWPSPSSKKLMFFFAGGGACWSYETCVTKSSSVHGPFGAAEFDKMKSGFDGWIISHADTSPFKDWTTVFVPYCTGDVHAGDNVKTYTDGQNSKDIHHKGRANVAAYLARLAATMPEVSQLGVTGSSAGGGGALFSHPAIRSYWPNADSFMVDDSLPLFKDNIPADMRKAWFENWNLDPLTTPFCGPHCVDDMSQFFPGLSKAYPKDRLGLLSYTTDYVILGYYQIGYFDYWKVLADFTKNTLDPLPNFKHYYVDAWGHTMLTNPNGFSGLVNWVNQMATNDPAWKSVH